MAAPTKSIPAATELEDITQQQDPDAVLYSTNITKVQDGDDALKFLQDHSQPYTRDEEKRVMRKVDLWMVSLMLVVNGIQFVDKNVRLIRSALGISLDH
jgi:hypothetical protein